jgi:Right handed beta helix region
VQQATSVTIRGNVIAYGESNVEVLERATGVAIAGNFLLNPRGPFPRGQNVQVWGASDASVRDNYTLSSRNTRRFLYPDDQEDSINFGEGSRFVADGNYVTGGHSASGCGLLADDRANEVRIVANRIVDSGECGIGVASGARPVVDRNRVINRNPVRGGGNTAVYVWNQYRSVPCGPVTVSNNVATEVRRNGTQSGFWNGGGCEPVVLRNDTWDEAARKLLTPVSEKLPPPPIPPRPHECVIASPYSTQTRWPECAPT